MSESLELDTLAPDTTELGVYAERAYLDYAMSVVYGRALPDVRDGEKPVQRRILYAMHRMGLNATAKHRKCAAVVGDVLGKYHPHGDTSVYDAAVRMSQDFMLRYPLIDGQGNFGSRDGDGAAAMRYTEARLTGIADLLLSELDQGTVDFRPNYDGTMQEPSVMPARLPILLLNGASGIAVGMATEIPSHNLTETALACEYLIRNPDATLEDILAIMPGPDFACGAQLISSADDVAKAYAGGRGSLRTRARWVVEPLARNQWQIAIVELPPGTSSEKVMLEIEALINPVIKAGAKALSAAQINLKALVLSVVSEMKNESDGEHPVHLVIEPRSSRQSPDDVMQVLLAHTSLELNFPMNLTSIGLDGKPQQKGLLPVLQEWVSFRYGTVTRRTEFRLAQVRTRMHILEGRLAVFLNIDEVIRIIRTSDEPKVELARVFGLSEVQATDILEIRLRQLATLERVKIEGELASLAAEADVLEELLADREKMTQLILSEIAADRLKYGDARRTLIETATRITTTSVATAADDPVTLIISKNGWLRSRVGHKADLSALTWKPGDEVLSVIETRSNQMVAFMDSAGRVYNVQASVFPSGRGDGIPLSSLADLGGNKLLHAFALQTTGGYLLVNTAGTGFVCPAPDLVTRQKAGKVVMTGLEEGDQILCPVHILNSQAADAEIAVAASSGKLLVFPLAQVKVMPKGMGVQLMSLGPKDRVVAVLPSLQAFTAIEGELAPAGRKVTNFKLAGEALASHRAQRARAGSFLPDKAPALILRVAGAASSIPSFNDDI